MIYLLTLALLLCNDNTQDCSIKMLYNEVNCLSDTIYYEARNQSEEGQIAVGEVILSRVKSDKFPNSICKVVHQNKQFSCYNTKNDIKNNIVEKRAKKKIFKIANKLLLGNSKKIVGTAYYYHNSNVLPKWAKKKKKIKKIGNHIFYR